MIEYRVAWLSMVLTPSLPTTLKFFPYIYVQEVSQFEIIAFNSRRRKLTKASTWYLTLKVPITTAADDLFCNVFLNFWKK